MRKLMQLRSQHKIISPQITTFYTRQKRGSRISRPVLLDSNIEIIPRWPILCPRESWEIWMTRRVCPQIQTRLWVDAAVVRAKASVNLKFWRVHRQRQCLPTFSSQTRTNSRKARLKLRSHQTWVMSSSRCRIRWWSRVRKKEAKIKNLNNSNT